MSRYEIVTEHTTFHVSTRPGMPGVGARVSGVTGQFDAAISDDGAVDLDEPVTGSFTLTVDDLETGNRLVNAGVRQFLGSRSEVAVAGRILSAKARDDGRTQLSMAVDIRHRTVKLVGMGRLRLDHEGRLEAAGDTMCDPRAFGVPLPPLVNLMVHVRWRMVLRPAEQTEHDARGD